MPPSRPDPGQILPDKLISGAQPKGLSQKRNCFFIATLVRQGHRVPIQLFNVPARGEARSNQTEEERRTQEDRPPP
jgi:hypothetical protein